MNPIPKELPLLARHAGTWEGTYRHIAPDFSLIDSHHFRILVEFPEEGSCHYRQSSHYWWEDGRTQDIIFEALCSDGKLRWDNNRIHGELWAVDDMTLYLSFGFADDPEVTIYEMIQLSPCGQHRARTWHWLRAGELFQITLVEESRA